MKPVAFDYHRPDTVAEAVALLSTLREEAMPLAGGMTLGPMLNLRVARPRAVIDISRIAALQEITQSSDMVVTGAGVVQNDALRSELVRREVPLLAMALPWVGHFQTRNRGTLGGSVAHADPSAEIPLCLTVCGGSVVLKSQRRERRLRAADFFVDALTTRREPDEIITALEWPRMPRGSGCAFAEIAQRHGDFAIAAAACCVSLGSDGRVADIALGLAGVESRPATIDAASFRNERPADVADGLSDHATAGLRPMDDRTASAEYRLALTKVLVARVFRDACADAERRGGALQ